MTLNKQLSKIRSDYVFIFSTFVGERFLPLQSYDIARLLGVVQEVVDRMICFSPHTSFR